MCYLCLSPDQSAVRERLLNLMTPSLCPQIRFLSLLVVSSCLHGPRCHVQSSTLPRRQATGRHQPWQQGWHPSALPCHWSVKDGEESLDLSAVVLVACWQQWSTKYIFMFPQINSARNGLIVNEWWQWLLQWCTYILKISLQWLCHLFSQARRCVRCAVPTPLTWMPRCRVPRRPSNTGPSCQAHSEGRYYSRRPSLSG